jgi:RsiW-degrading membrane proteinase PrsW (M82 family)
MLLHMAILIIGGSYLLYRYRSVTNKKRFFSSPLFQTATGSLAILLSAVLFVNYLGPEEETSVQSPTDQYLEAQPAEFSDTTFQQLAVQNTLQHYELIGWMSGDTEYADELNAIEKNYMRMTASSDPHLISIGHFGLGVIHLERREYETAENHLDKVTEPGLACVSFCKATIALYHQHDTLRAEQEFFRELETEYGNHIQSIANLYSFYEAKQDYGKIIKLLDYPGVEEVIPEEVIRQTFLQANQFVDYVVWWMKMIWLHANGVGVFAALLIALMWLIYLSRLDIFKPERFVGLVTMFAAGMISVLTVFILHDIVSSFFDWGLDGGVVNDLLYAIFMIGVSEEFAKALPLFALLLILKKFREPIDYIVYGSASALGFAFLENVMYFEEVSGGIIHGRAYLSVIGHMVDTSIVAYGFVIMRFQLKTRKGIWYIIPASFLLAAIVHGIYDWLLFMNLRFLFFIFFILVVQIWMIIINNCMNNSSHFNYRLAPQVERSRLYITLALTTIFAFEYMYVGFSTDSSAANDQLFANAGFAGFMIIFFSSNLSSFDLIKGHWINIRMSHSEKRGYGSRQPLHPFISWYFVNALQSHNYVGLRIKISNDPHNKILGEIMSGEYAARIIDRKILSSEEGDDPNWFIVKLIDPIPLATDRNDYLLVKPRYNQDSLLYEDEVEIFFKGIPDISMLQRHKPDKKEFPFYGWAYMSLIEKKVSVKTAVAV